MLAIDYASDWKTIAKYGDDKDKAQITRAIVQHHLSYQDNETITVCQSCNIKIAKDPNYRRLFKPIDKRPKGNKLARKTCTICNEQFQPRNKNQIYCSRCRIKLKTKPVEEEKIPVDWVTKTYG